MFAEVEVQLGETRHVVALPVSAITYNPYGDAVFVLKPVSDSEGKGADPSSGEDTASKKVFVASRIFVKTGAARDAKVEIREGVKPGDIVVTAGQIKLRTTPAWSSTTRRKWQISLLRAPVQGNF